jgi:hypothetical protein
MKKIIHFLRYTNFFGRPTIIRKWQCNLWGHNERCIYHKHKVKWCAWCGRNAEEGK